MTLPIESVAIETTCVDQTLALGARLGEVLLGGLVIAVTGELGAGKTHLVKGIAVGNGAGDAREVTSPTFTLLHEYRGRLRLYHIDAYRLGGPVELLALGFDELISMDSVVAIEWADRVGGAIGADRLQVRMESVDAQVRRLTLSAHGPIAVQCLAAMRR